MTKRRDALTFENALSKVAGHIGWPRTAEIVGQAERTVRNWSDPDTTASITLDAALKLDVEYHNAGGEGAPFLLCYATRIDTERLMGSPERQALIAGAARSAKEAGEAIEAILKAAHAAASLADVAIGKREIEEAISALTNSLATLQAREKALKAQERHEEDDERELARAPEVAPPIAN